jgi:hypothetical protein
MSSLNSNPILITADVTSWKASQTLNTGNQPATQQSTQFGRTATSQPGIRVYRIQVLGTAGTSAGVITIIDPNDSSVRWQGAVAASTTVGTILIDETFSDNMPMWRDFSTTGVTAAAVTLAIWYRI